MKICALIICYRDKTAVQRCIEALKKQTTAIQRIYVVDNSEVPVFSGQEDGTNGLVTIINSSRNIGIAGGLNLGFQQAVTDGFDWCWTFDQDSEPGSEALEELVKSFSVIKVPLNKIGIVASTGVSRLYNALYKGNRAKWLLSKDFSDHKKIVYECDLVITAGSLTNLDFFREGWMLDENLFIDWVDFYLCIAMKTEGYRIFSCNTSMYHHQIGDRGAISYEKDVIDRKRIRMVRGYCFLRNATYVVTRNAGPFQYAYLLYFLIREYKRIGRTAVPFLLFLSAVRRGVTGDIRSPWSECSKYFETRE